MKTISKEAVDQRGQELSFCLDLDRMPHDKYYQDIELPSGLAIPGYSRSRESWKRLHQIIDFNDKDVLDIGCFHGFFSFKAEEAGAKNIVGVDIHENAIKVARRIAWLRNSKVRFYLSDLVSFKTDHVYDIVLVLNMLHHVKDIHRALHNMFKAGKLIVFEIPVTQEDIISEYARRFAFNFTAKMNSHRAEREIIIFANSQADALSQRIPSAYEYHYRIEYIKRLRNRVMTQVLKIHLFYPLVWLVRKYRSLRKPNVRPLLYHENMADRQHLDIP